MTVQIAVRIADDQFDQLDYYSQTHGSRAAVMRQALREFFERRAETALEAKHRQGYEYAPLDDDELSFISAAEAAQSTAWAAEHATDW